MKGSLLNALTWKDVEESDRNLIRR